MSIARAALLGRRTAEMHQAFAVETDDAAFAPEPIREKDIDAWTKGLQKQIDQGLDSLNRSFDALDEAQADAARRLLDSRKRLERVVERLARTPAAGRKTRLHGDYHLGQVLVAAEDFSVIDFEGEPRKTLVERRQKSSPLRDVAGMLRSFDYAAWSVLDHLWLDGRTSDIAVAALEDWRGRATEAFLRGYREAMAESESPARAPEETAEGLLQLFLLEKAFYEIDYEAAHRPKWLHVPVRGALELLERTDPEDKDRS
jgi:maltose alpha-D-glucosyltransferase/alpha-amylase